MEDVVEDKKTALAANIDLQFNFTFANWVEGSPNTPNWATVIGSSERPVGLEDRSVWCCMDRATRVQTPSSRQLGGFSRHGEIRVSNGLHYVAFWFLFFRECDIAVTSAIVFIGARFGSRIALTSGIIVSRVSIPTRLARLP